MINQKKNKNFEYNKYFLERENSIITDLFYTQIINIFNCKCGYESYSFQKLLDIPLLVPTETREINLYNLIEMFNNKISVDLDNKCKKCKKRKKNIKIQIKFNIINELIIFSVQRFDPLLSVKNESLIIYDELIDLKPYSDTPIFEKNLKYKLIGTIHHNGNLQYGHHFSNIKIENEWYEFNDSLVTKIQSFVDRSSNVCVLFYQKVY